MTKFSVPFLAFAVAFSLTMADIFPASAQTADIPPPAPHAAPALAGKTPVQTDTLTHDPATGPDQVPGPTDDLVATEENPDLPPVLTGETEDPEQAPGVPRETLPHDLSPWGMFMQADWVVKAVMIGLAAASLVTWTVLLAKAWELRCAKRAQSRTLATIRTARTAQDAGQSLKKADTACNVLLDAALAETALSADALSDREGLKERILWRLEREELAMGRRMQKGTGVLATIGATAPFVGLFGTVWGIMNSFIGISKSQTTNLAVVAPGIAEALLATALGLVAAIPAVIIYNHFAREIAAYKALLSDTSAEILRLISRDLSRGVLGPDAALPATRQPKAVEA